MILRNEEESHVEGEAQRSGDDWGVEADGIGPETADSILLYAGNHPAFVVDAYTRRILERHALIHARASYDEIQGLFERSLPQDTGLYNEYHALIVNVGKEWCRSRNPRCSECPLQPFLPERATAAIS